LGVKPTAAFEKAVTEKHDDVLDYKYISGVTTLAEKKALLDGQLKAAISDKPIAIRAKVNAALGILESERFKSSFETGTGKGGAHGTSTLQAHSDTQHDAFSSKKNYTTDAKISKRPIYGIVLGATGKTGEASSYGEITFVLKDSVKGRTTVTAEDSFYSQVSKNVMPSPYNSPKSYSIPLSSSGKPGYMVKSGGLDLYGGARYVEAQVHGGVSLSDVAKVIINPAAMSHWSYSSLISSLQTKGIPYETSYD
jgi:hypothetical protein